MIENLIHRTRCALARHQRLLAVAMAMAIASGALLVETRGYAAGPPTVANVDITKFMFGPKELTVAPGTTVRWTNHDEVPHTVASQNKSMPFASKALDTDDSFDSTLTKEGDYTYICTVHPFMVGVVHVRKP